MIRKISVLYLALMLLIFTGCSTAGTEGGKVGMQFDKPQKGEEIAVLHTELGDIKVRLFPEQAPKGVENFKLLIEQGYYSDKVFHRAEENFCIQALSDYAE